MPDNQTDNLTPIKSGHRRFRPVGEKGRNGEHRKILEEKFIVKR